MTEAGPALRLLHHQPLLQTESALQSLADLPGVDIPVPDHTTFCRRSANLTILPKHIEGDEPLHLLVDSAGVKIYGEGEWLDEKHGVRSRRRWRNLHVGVDANSHQIVAVELTADDVDDVSIVPDLLDQIEGELSSKTGDGAYDAQSDYDAAAARHPRAAVIIPHRSTAVASETAATQRDQRLAIIAKRGRMTWRRSSGYSRRS